MITKRSIIKAAGTGLCSLVAFYAGTKVVIDGFDRSSKMDYQRTPVIKQLAVTGEKIAGLTLVACSGFFIPAEVYLSNGFIRSYLRKPKKSSS